MCRQVLKIVQTLAVALLLESCAVSKTQLQKVNSLAVSGDSVSVAPGRLFEGLSEIRLERGLFYAASLQGTENRLRELNGLARQAESDQTLSNKAGVYVKVLDSYLKALKSVSSDTRWKQSGVELRGIGRNADSLIIAYNALHLSDKIDVGVAKQAGKTGGYVAERIARQSQGRIVKGILHDGDSLVTLCCNGLIDVLKDKRFDNLLNNEATGIEANYRSYLNAMSVQGFPADLGFDRTYVKLQNELAASRKLRNQCTSALRSLQKAHHKLYLSIDKKAAKAENGGKRPRKTKSQRNADLQEWSDALYELAAQVNALLELME